MLNRASFLTFTILLCSFFSIGYALFSFDEADIVRFTQWKTAKKTPSHRPPIHQIKKGVQKDLFLCEEGSRRHIQIAHENGFLTYSSDKGAHEELYNITGYIQESTADGVSQMRKFQSERGTYSLSDHKFQAEEVLMTFYQAEGTQLVKEIDEVTMRGRARSVELCLENKDLSMRANHFQATIPKESANAILN